MHSATVARWKGKIRFLAKKNHIIKQTTQNLKERETRGHQLLSRETMLGMMTHAAGHF